MKEIENIVVVLSGFDSLHAWMDGRQGSLQSSLNLIHSHVNLLTNACSFFSLLFLTFDHTYPISKSSRFIN